ncbi:DUF2208 domain-containing protein [Desulfurococcaceae archaeon MEX13E-LK6-19]|nr:DUF2208 domain-containing protein [Desulfurococcaceae archaeon MEX13E-LK6-19]
MYQQPSRKYTIILSESAIVLMSVISAFFPGYFIIAIILYTILIFGLTSYTMTKKTRAKPEELKTPLFRENNAMKIAMADKELSKELMQQMRSTLMLFITFPLILVLFPLYTSYIGPYVESALQSSLNNELAAKFLNFFIMYNFVFAIISLVRLGLSKIYKPINILLPQRFVVYPSGILANNRMFIRFTDDHCYKYDPIRKFIEIRSEKNPGFKIKLYSENITRLKEKLVEKNILRECKE